MTAAKKAFQKPQDKTDGEWLWLLGFRFLGAIMVLVSLLPIMWELATKVNPDIHIGETRGWIMAIGFFFVWGSGIFAGLANSMGLAIGSFIEKFTR